MLLAVLGSAERGRGAGQLVVTFTASLQLTMVLASMREARALCQALQHTQHASEKSPHNPPRRLGSMRASINPGRLPLTATWMSTCSTSCSEVQVIMKRGCQSTATPPAVGESWNTWQPPGAVRGSPLRRRLGHPPIRGLCRCSHPVRGMPETVWPVVCLPCAIRTTQGLSSHEIFNCSVKTCAAKHAHLVYLGLPPKY